MNRKTIGIAMAVVCGALAFYCADRATARPGGDYGPMGIAFAVLTPLFIAIAFMEGEGGGDRNVTTNVTTNITLPDWMQHPPQHQQVQYIPVYDQTPAPPPQIVYLQAEPQAALPAPPPAPSITPQMIAAIVAQEMQAHRQLPPPQPEAPRKALPLERLLPSRQLPRPRAEAVQIDQGYRRMEVLPPSRTEPARPETLRLAGPKKSIADRVAVALLTKPKPRA